MTISPDLQFSPERVFHIRIGLGLTQEQFAVKVGVTVNTISSWERGVTPPRNGPSLHALLAAEKEVAAQEDVA